MVHGLLVKQSRFVEGKGICIEELVYPIAIKTGLHITILRSWHSLNVEKLRMSMFLN